MKEKNSIRLIYASLGLTIVSFMFLLGLIFFNARRLTMLSPRTSASVVVAIIVALISFGLVVYIIECTFVPFFRKKPVNQQKFLNLLVITLVFRVVLYLVFQLIGVSFEGGFFPDLHVVSFALTQGTDLLPVTAYPDGALSFINHMLSTDILGIGLVIVGYLLIKKDKYAPVMAITASILINIVAIIVINIVAGNQYGSEFVYKFDSAFATMITEFALIGFVVQDIFLKKKSAE